MIGARRISLREIFSTEKSLKLFENGYHELQHDEEFDELKNVVNDWMTRRLQKPEVLGSSYESFRKSSRHDLPISSKKIPTKKTQATDHTDRIPGQSNYKVIFSHKDLETNQ